MINNEHEPYRQILATAVPFDFSVVTPEPADARRRSAPGYAPELERSAACLKALLAGGHIALDFHTWYRVGAALKHTHGDEGFDVFHDLSAQAPNYESEDDCRSKCWNRIGDKPEGERITMATFFDLAKKAGIILSAARRHNDDAQGPANTETSASSRTADADDGLPKFASNADPAAVAVCLAEHFGDEFWLNQYNEPYVTFAAKSKEGDIWRRHTPIDSGLYRNVLGQRYIRARKMKVLPKEQASNAIEILKYQAADSGNSFSSFLRVGQHDGKIFIDLGRPSGAAVEVDADGWRPCPNPPVRFSRGARGALPDPEEGGTLDDFEAHFNLSKADIVRAVAYMIGTFNLSGSFAIAIVEGEQGTGKSNLADMMLALIDPPTDPKGARLSMARDERDLIVSAKNSHVLFYDNVSSISAATADSLCRFVTGGTSAVRALYTNSDEAQVSVLRPIIMTCIGQPTTRGDLLSRSLAITARPLGPARRTEKSVWLAFEAARPRLFGFLLTCVSAALRNAKAVELAVESGALVLPRLADFGLFVEGAAEPLGLKPGEFCALITDEQDNVQIDAALGDAVGGALLAYFTKDPSAALEGPARDVTEALMESYTGDHKWPASNKFGAQLNRIAVGLRALGIEWEVSEPSGRANVTTYRFYTTDQFNPAAVKVSLSDGVF